MRLAWLPFLFALTVTAGAAPVRNLAPGDINAAALNGAKNSEAVNIKAQVLLDRARFSPGAIDGRDGDNFANALRAFQKKNAPERERQARQGDLGEARAETPSRH